MSSLSFIAWRMWWFTLSLYGCRCGEVSRCSSATLESVENACTTGNPTTNHCNHTCTMLSNESFLKVRVYWSLWLSLVSGLTVASCKAPMRCQKLNTGFQPYRPFSNPGYGRDDWRESKKSGNGPHQPTVDMQLPQLRFHFSNLTASTMNSKLVLCFLMSAILSIGSKAFNIQRNPRGVLQRSSIRSQELHATPPTMVIYWSIKSGESPTKHTRNIFQSCVRFFL